MNNTSAVLENTTAPCSTSLCSQNQNVSQGPPGTSIYDDVLEGLAYVNYVLLPTMLVLGIGGNILTITIMTSPKFRKLTCRFYLIFLALSDLALLLTQPFNKMFVIKMFGEDVRAISDVGCKIFFWFFRTGKMTSSWFVVCLCIERFIAVWFPLKAKIISTSKSAWIQISCVYLVIGTFNGIWTKNSKVLSDGKCYPDHFDKKDHSAAEEYKAMLTAGSSLYSLVPLCLLVTVTPLIVFKLARHRQQRKRLAATSKSDTAQATKTTAMLIGIVVAYFVLVLPITLLHNIAFYMGMKSFGDNPKGFLIFRDVAQILEQINYGINFYLYILTSTQFRHQLISYLTENRIYKMLRQVTSTGSRTTSSKLSQNTPDNKDLEEKA
ncbi:growth hormone secretagogue receptor type 1-like [Ostrea edulis]|uniref:growth hormone secretagogue receptor type 1-like n=1 Tax=Ostrea edulis TaxID=37623 RepID=UPI0024AFCCA4|nr:growth hormone secretagogue receptor type 1-like [Ostrea edulis]